MLNSREISYVAFVTSVRASLINTVEIVTLFFDASPTRGRFDGYDERAFARGFSRVYDEGPGREPYAKVRPAKISQAPTLATLISTRVGAGLF